MKNKSIGNTASVLTAAVILFVAAFAGNLFSGGLEDAQAALKAGRAAEVDGILGDLLDSKPCDIKVLSVSLDAAYEIGNYYTAERRIQSILELSATPSSQILYKGGMAARRLGRKSLERDRFTYFLQLEKGATPQTRDALFSVCRSGADAEMFIRLVSQFGTDDIVFNAGIANLRGLRRIEKGDEYGKLVKFIAGKWKGRKEVLILAEELVQMNNANVFSFGREKIWDAAVDMNWTSAQDFAGFAGRISNWNGINTKWSSKIQSKILAANGGTEWTLLGNTLNINWASEAERPECAKRVASMIPALCEIKWDWVTRQLLQSLHANRALYFEGEKPLVTPEQAEAVLRSVYADNDAAATFEFDNFWGAIDYVWEKSRMTVDQKKALINKFPKIISYSAIGNVYHEQVMASRNPATMRTLMTQCGGRTGLIWYRFRDALSEFGDKQLFSDVFIGEMTVNPFGFDWGSATEIFDANKYKYLTEKDRAEILTKLLKIRGCTGEFDNLMSRSGSWKGPEFEALRTLVKSRPRPEDAFINACWLINEAKDAKEIHEAAAKAISLRPGRHPAGDHLKAAQYLSMARRYADRIRQTNNRDEALKAVKALLPGNACWQDGWFWQFTWWAGQDAVCLYEKTKITAKPGYKGGTGCDVPNGSKDLIFANNFRAVKGDSVSVFVLRNIQRWDPVAAAAALTKLVETHPANEWKDALKIIYETDKLRNKLNEADKETPKKNYADLIPWKALADQICIRGLAGEEVARAMGRNLIYAGKYSPDITAAMIGRVKKLPPVQKTIELSALASSVLWNNILAVEVYKTPEEDAAATNGLTAVLIEWEKAASALSCKSGIPVPGYAIRELDNKIYRNAKLMEQLSPGRKAEIQKIFVTAADVIAEGGWSERIAPRDYANVFIRITSDAADRGDSAAVSRLARSIKESCRDDWPGEYTGLLKKLEGLKMWEQLYLIAEWLPLNNPRFNDAAKLRGEASGHMPGIYPVQEGDKAYPLYVAADMFAQRNYERAWTLLSENAGEFELNPLRFSTPFVAWAVEQFRKVRGDNDKLHELAKRLVDTILVKEKEIPAELTGSLMLTRAEIARDAMRYENARAEYQALRNHPVYQKTPAGREAMFRDVDLMVTMGNAEGAEQTIEQWLAVPDQAVQAQAHYMLARLAFDRKDYDETKSQLTKVFDIDFTHTEARLLQGRWKLATNYEVDDTQVLLGELSDRSLIRPGQPLAISVPDRNLGVAGGGAAIPILITTTSGDNETLSVYPSTRDPFLFKGIIDSRLAGPKPGNRILDLSGGDTVSYSISPEYLKSRGLAESEVKTLSVADDALMAVSAAVPDADDAAAAEEIERNLSGAADGALVTSLTRNLRPGSPIHIAVRDRDRFTMPSNNVASVTVTTSSGDMIPQFNLKETAPYSGVFRGAVPTALPPPRASASDFAAGSNPGDVINSGRKGTWKSLPDGKKGKWFAIDTMGSHLTASTEIGMSRPGDVLALRLYGSLADGEFLLGAYPGESASVRDGVRLIAMRSDARNMTEARREITQKQIQAVKTTDWVVMPEADNQGWRFFLRGAIALKESRTLRFKFESMAKTAEPQWQMQSLGVVLTVDGRVVYSGGGRDIQKSVTPVHLPAGPHELEIYASTWRKADAFRLALEDDSGSATVIPASWSDVKENPELEKLLGEAAKLTKTATGFKAECAEPVRLRSIRWEFADFTGPEIEVTSAKIVTDQGKAVIPCAHDYSDALKNSVLEVAPGDTIRVTYADDVTCSGEKRSIERTLSSSFHDANVEFLFEYIGEDANGRPVQTFNPAYRIQAGDSLFVRVADPDMDRTPDADKVKITIRSSNGMKMTMNAVELKKRNGDKLEVAGGVYFAIVRTAEADTVEKGKPGILPIRSGDMIEVRYLDEENTKPGIPVERKTKISSVLKSEPEITLYDTWNERVADTGDAVEQKLGQIRRRPGNDDVTNIWKNISWGAAMKKSDIEDGRGLTANLAIPVPVSIRDASRARHAASTVMMKAAVLRELEAAKTESREPFTTNFPLRLNSGFASVRIKDSAVTEDGPVESKEEFPDTFSGSFRPILDESGDDGDSSSGSSSGIPELKVRGDDVIVLSLLAEDGTPVITKHLRLVAAAEIDLMDSTYTATRTATHPGEPFYVRVVDQDRDLTDEQDSVEVSAKASSASAPVNMILTETLPHSGIFTGTVVPEYAAQIKPAADAGNSEEKQPAPETALTKIPVVYGDTIVFTYNDEKTIPSKKPGPVAVTGRIHKGSDASVRMFSKRFRDSDQAVLVQFRLAECLFETAKDMRKLKQAEKSAAVIAEGRETLETALRDYPGTKHAAEGEFLLANLYQELAEEERQAENHDAARPLYEEALARFSAIIATWPDGDFAARSQYHKAFCLEMLGDFSRAAEEYVKMTYIFPDSPLVGDASVRLATYYYSKENRYDIAGKIYSNFQRRFPNHQRASRALFMGGQCHVKQGDLYAQQAEEGGKDAARKAALSGQEYEEAVKSFMTLVDVYRDSDDKNILAQSYYWAGDASFKVKDYKNAYLYLQNVVLKYPETEWARRARGMLLQEDETFKNLME